MNKIVFFRFSAITSIRQPPTVSKDSSKDAQLNSTSAGRGRHVERLREILHPSGQMVKIGYFSPNFDLSFG